jgi:hypothetical protein
MMSCNECLNELYHGSSKDCCWIVTAVVTTKGVNAGTSRCLPRGIWHVSLSILGFFRSNLTCYCVKLLHTIAIASSMVLEMYSYFSDA